MNKVNFSIILPTRDRPELFKKFLNSVRDKAKWKEKIEILVIVQSDDPEMMDKIDWFREEYKDINIRIWVKEWVRSYASTYKNFLSKQAKGKFVISGDDEHIYHTQDWDDVALNKLETFLEGNPHRICFIMPEDNNGTNFTCVPILSKEAIEVLGYFYHPRFPGWGADAALYEIFKGVPGTICRIPIKIEHKSWHYGAREKDKINRLVEVISNKAKVPIVAKDTGEMQQKIKDTIKNCRGGNANTTE